MALGAAPSEKLTRVNFPLWQAQVLPAIRGAQAMGLLDGTDAAPAKMVTMETADKTSSKTTTNPDYAAWLARDQQVLSYLLNSFSPEILQHVLRLEHAASVWSAVEKRFAS